MPQPLLMLLGLQVKKGQKQKKNPPKRKPEGSGVQKCVSKPTFRTNARWDI